MSNRDPWLAVERLTRSFRVGGSTLEVLKGITMEVRPREILAIVGPSGAGKSTLLHLMGFLDRPTSGDVRFQGRSLDRSSEWAQCRTRNRCFGFVFQLHHLLPELTALENALLPLMIESSLPAWPARGPAARRRVLGLLERVRMGHRLHHRPQELSVGERQRVAMARALACDPQIVFCDEPTGSLDVETGRQILRLIRELRDETGKTFVVVSHDPAIAELADRTVRMVDGRISSS
jgi:ABC-type lipoprotein export system ATPase subunit